MSKHSIISPSKAKRWINCPFSAKEEAKFPDTTSSYAQEGTDAHSLLEWCLLFNIDPLEVETAKINDVEMTFSEEMRECVSMAYEYTKKLERELGAKATAETRYELTWLHKELSGTCDVTIREPFGELIIMDYKHGKGVDVKVENNEQLMIYALGALGELHKSGVEIYSNIRLVILQPRTSSEPKEWNITPKELRLWGDKVLKPAAVKAAKGSKSAKVGEWCHWCKVGAAMKCPKKNAKELELFKNESTVPDVKNLTPNQMAEIYVQLPRFNAWVENLEKALYSHLIEGNKVEGLKLVEGKSARKWKDENVAKETLERLCPDESFYVTKFVTAPQAEKILKKVGGAALASFDDLVEKPQGKPTIASIDDKRPALVLDAATLFHNEEKTDE